MKTKKGRRVTPRYIPLVINGFRFDGTVDTWAPKPKFNIIRELMKSLDECEGR